VSGSPVAAKILSLALVLACCVIAAGGVIAISRAGVASASAPHGRCTPQGRVVLDTSEVTVWTAPGGRLYSCVRASGDVHRVVHANASAKGFLAAGRYVGFTYTVGDEDLRLDIFSTLSGAPEFNLPLNHECDPHIHDGMCTSLLSGFQLASNGWLAEYGLSSLTASNGHDSTIGLDTGPGLSISHLHSLSADGVAINQGTGSTLAWTPEPNSGALYSVALGPGLAALDGTALEDGAVHPAIALPATCGLFTAAEAQAVLGAGTQSTSSDSCTYITTGTPRSILTVTLAPNLTSAQVLAAKQAAYGQESSNQPEQPSSLGPPDYGKYLWQASWNSYVGGESAPQSQIVKIFGDLELTVGLVTKPRGNDVNYQVGTSQCWGAETAVEHVADIAFDRLMGVPITFIHSAGRSCVKANEKF
jgi:hypothetical protein